MLVDLAVALALLGCSALSLLIWAAWHLNELDGKPPGVLVAIAIVTLALGTMFARDRDQRGAQGTSVRVVESARHCGGIAMIPTLAILISLAIVWDIARTLLRSWRHWPEPRAHHRFRCGGACRFSHDDAGLFAAHVDAWHLDLDGPVYGIGTAPCEGWARWAS